MLSPRRTVAALVLATPFVVCAAQAGDVTLPVALGTSVWTYTWPQNGKPAKTVTISDRFVLTEAIGLGYAVTDRLRLGFNLNFSEAITNRPRQVLSPDSEWLPLQ
jgi:hypothetical protein